MWLFICADMTEQLQVAHYVQSHEGLKMYSQDYIDYIPLDNKRLGDHTASSAKAKQNVKLMFLQNPRNATKYHIDTKNDFTTLETPMYQKARHYNELEFRGHNGELRMEFYLSILSKYCFPGRNVLILCIGRKLTCTVLAALLCCCTEAQKKLLGAESFID